MSHQHEMTHKKDATVVSHLQLNLGTGKMFIQVPFSIYDGPARHVPLEIIIGRIIHLPLPLR